MHEEQPLKILLAEDDRIFALALKNFLHRSGFEVESVHDGLSALGVVQSPAAPRIAIIDWTLPGLDGLELCRRIREESLQKSAPSYCFILMLTARGEKQDIIDGLGAGADDYLVKPIDFDELKAHLGTAQRIIQLQDQLLTCRNSLRDQATRDSLTGVWNRAMILDIMRSEAKRSQREARSLGAIMADVDHFKVTNDTFGHPAGDQVLSEVARRMVAALRPYDAIGRYGGDEFLALLPGCDIASASAIAERIRGAVAQAPVVHGDIAIRVTVTLGVSAGSAIQDSDSLIGAADLALYRAKNSGRNRVE